MKIQKQNLPVFIDENDEPRALIYFNKNRERIIYNITKAGEDELIELYECKDTTIKQDEETTA